MLLGKTPLARWWQSHSGPVLSCSVGPVTVGRRWACEQNDAGPMLATDSGPLLDDRTGPPLVQCCPSIWVVTRSCRLPALFEFLNVDITRQSHGLFALA